MKKKNLAFTLAEVLIVIGIIGVVAALTLPNLNHATGDKETVTRLQKAYSILNEANDRAVAIYGPLSSWPNKDGECFQDDNNCWMKRIGEFLKISKVCDESDYESDNYSSCESFKIGEMNDSNIKIFYQLSDGITFGITNCYSECDGEYGQFKSLCSTEIKIDINGPQKGKNEYGKDIFRFMLSDLLGVVAFNEFEEIEDQNNCCIDSKDYECTYWVLEFGNLDYLKADDEGKCKDSNIVLDGVTNTSCH